jgi:hypothetical protein
MSGIVRLSLDRILRFDMKADMLVVCHLGQNAGRAVKVWYDSSWGQKRR